MHFYKASTSPFLKGTSSFTLKLSGHLMLLASIKYIYHILVFNFYDIVQIIRCTRYIGLLFLNSFINITCFDKYRLTGYYMGYTLIWVLSTSDTYHITNE